MGSSNILRLWQAALDNSDPVKLDMVSGDYLILQPKVDDTGYLAIGDGTYDMDVKWYGGTSAKYVLCDVGNSLLTLEDIDLHLGDNDEVQFGDATGGDVQVYWNASNLIVEPVANDTGAIWLGHTTGPLCMDVQWAAAAAKKVTFDVGVASILTSDVDVKLIDNDSLFFGTATGAGVADGDVQIRWDGTDLDILAAADDSTIMFGNGTNSFDVVFYGNIATAYAWVDASASTLELQGPMRPVGFDSTVSRRYELKHYFGAHGLPQLNAVADVGTAFHQGNLQATFNVDMDFEILGTSASSDDVTAHPEGGIKIETDGGANDQVIILPHLNTGQTAWTTVTWGTDQETTWECLIRTGSSIAKTTIWAGLKKSNTSNPTTDSDQCIFYYDADTNGGEWVAHSRYGAGPTNRATDTNVVAAANTTYHLKVAIDSGRLARFYLNGVLVDTTPQLDDTQDLIPYIGIQATDANARHMYVYSCGISRNVG